MRLLQTIREISSKLPSESYQKLSRLIHAKDILGSFYVLMEVPLFLAMNENTVLKLLLIYVSLLIFQVDMQYMNCVCVLKACFKRVNDNLELMINDEKYHLGQMYYQQRSTFLLIKLKALKQQHLKISNAVQMLNIIFSLQLLATIILTFIEITFQFYYLILYWQKGISMINVDDDIYNMYMTVLITYYFIKMMLIVWVCETGKNQALQIGTTVHDVLNSINNNEIKSEVIKNVF